MVVGQLVGILKRHYGELLKVERERERERERESILKAQVPGVSMRPHHAHCAHSCK